MDSLAKGWPCQSPEHEADHGEADEGGDGCGVALEVAGQATVAADPGERAFHDPAFGQDHEAMQLGAFDDLELPGAGPGDRRGGRGALIAGVGEDAFDEREGAARRSIEDQERAVAVLHIGGMDDDVQEQAERVDQDVPLAAGDLLGAVVAAVVGRLGGLDRLAVDAAGAGRRLPTRLAADLLAQGVVDGLPGPVGGPSDEVVINGPPGGKVMR